MLGRSLMKVYDGQQPLFPVVAQNEVLGIQKAKTRSDVALAEIGSKRDPKPTQRPLSLLSPKPLTLHTSPNPTMTYHNLN